jgi:hypothetical protein
MRYRSFFAVLVLQIGFACDLFAQQANTSEVKTHELAAELPTDKHVILDVVVRDKGGKPIASLQKEDLVLLDDKNRFLQLS